VKSSKVTEHLRKVASSSCEPNKEVVGKWDIVALLKSIFVDVVDFMLLLAHLVDHC